MGRPGSRLDVKAAAKSDQKLGKILGAGLNHLRKEKSIILLGIDDYQTRGLEGDEGLGGNEDLAKKDSNFAAFAKNVLELEEGICGLRRQLRLGEVGLLEGFEVRNRLRQLQP